MGPQNRGGVKSPPPPRLRYWHSLDSVLLEPGPKARQEHCGEEPLDADLRHRERNERDAYRAAAQWGTMG